MDGVLEQLRQQAQAQRVPRGLAQLYLVSGDRLPRQDLDRPPQAPPLFFRSCRPRRSRSP
jgi:hypothetical protein